MTTLDELKQLRRNESAFYFYNQRYLFQAITFPVTGDPQLHGMDGKNKHWTITLSSLALQEIKVVRKARQWANRRRFIATRVDTCKVGASHPHEAADCTVHALAVCAGIPYADAHAFLKSRGRKDGHGMRMWEYHLSNYAGVHGKFVPVTSRIREAINPAAWDHITVGQVLKSNLLPKRCIIGIKGHVFAVIDGMVYETTRQCGSSKRVLDIMEFQTR